MEIRRLGEEDAEILEAAVRRLFTREDLPRGPASRPHLSRALADPSGYYLVCMSGNEPVGFLGAYRFPAVEPGFLVYLYDIVVEARHRRRGIATRLITHLKDCCRADDVVRIWVGTSLENGAAQRAFERTGARKVSETYVEYVYDLDGPVGR